LAPPSSVRHPPKSALVSPLSVYCLLGSSRGPFFHQRWTFSFGGWPGGGLGAFHEDPVIPNVESTLFTPPAELFPDPRGRINNGLFCLPTPGLAALPGSPLRGRLGFFRVLCKPFFCTASSLTRPDLFQPLWLDCTVNIPSGKRSFLTLQTSLTGT